MADKPRKKAAPKKAIPAKKAAAPKKKAGAKKPAPGGATEAMSKSRGPHSDDSLMGRFEGQGLMKNTARDAIASIAFVSLVLLLFAGGAVRSSADQLDPGLGRDIVKAVGHPTGWVADQLPLSDIRSDATSWLSPDQELSGCGFESQCGNTLRGKTLAEPGKLDTLLVTGDSLSTPLDVQIAQQSASTGIKVIRDPHLGTGISNTGLADWSKISTTQAKDERPNAVVMFIGANEGYPITGPDGKAVTYDGGSGGDQWGKAYETRVKRVMANYLTEGVAVVYWLTVPTPRDADHATLDQVVNRHVKLAAKEFPGHVVIIDTVPIFTPGEKYRDSMPIDGTDTIVRRSDGIHFNDAGAAYAAGIVLDEIHKQFSF